MKKELIVLGKFNDKEIVVDLNEVSHISLSAVYGHGKTNLMENLVEQILKNDEKAEVYVLSRCETSFIYKDIEIKRRALNKNQYINILSEINERIEERRYEEDPSRIVIVIDDGCLENTMIRSNAVEAIISIKALEGLEDTRIRSDDIMGMLYNILEFGRVTKVNVLSVLYPESFLERDFQYSIYKYKEMFGVRLEGKLEHSNKELNPGEFYLDDTKKIKIQTKKSKCRC